MSPSQTNEQALEAAIEKSLCGFSKEESKDHPQIWQEEAGSYQATSKFIMGQANDFNAKYAIDENRFWHFLENSQKEELEKLKRSSDWKLKILVDRLTHVVPPIPM
ncbi:hypothetical protein [Lentimicrobium sp. S6]|uniref:hypothetical protein n=1 Tax=Lentimicrobium sp. S6 TaxID=2735872 RepID=UPI0015558D44|nr:hypothetical protein [Lentimicrobium sp. S6]NPD47051.1 hypothetical protein [Lentimicrobium sp. S6]